MSSVEVAALLERLPAPLVGQLHLGLLLPGFCRGCRTRTVPKKIPTKFSDSTRAGMTSRGKTRACSRSSRWETEMTDPLCRPLPILVPRSEIVGSTDRFAELLGCLADLLVETSQQVAEIEVSKDHRDCRVTEALALLGRFRRSLTELSVEAASVHQQLRHVRLI